MRHRHRTALGVTLSRLIGLIVFLVLLIIANTLPIYNTTYTEIIGFLNQNIGLIVFFTVLLYLGELFMVFMFPINLPAPIFNAFGGVLLARFIFSIFYFIGIMLGTTAFFAFKYLEALFYIIIFLIVIIVGYVQIFAELGKREKRMHERQISERKKEDIKWKDVGEEFRKAAYNVAANLKESLEPKEKQKKKKDAAAKNVRKSSKKKK
jgi:hypothetical protein